MSRKGAGSKANNYLFVAAIDFGTAYSGYAFSSTDDFDKEPLKISANTWGAGKFMSAKTSTCILFDKNRKFHSFGFDAEDNYSGFALDNEHHDYYFFRRFKMTLFDKLKLKRKFMLEDEMGKKMPALDVFSSSIKFLHDNLLDKMRQQFPDVSNSDIRWVLTVPAIWNDVSKQFMREAAEKAGILGENLMFALEPEAASLCCRHLPLTSLSGSGRGFEAFKPKSKYLVFDAGGGTVDITVHEVRDGGTVRELYKANGGNWGGTYIDKAFRDFLADIVGNDVMDNFQVTRMMDYIDLFREFEVKKRSFKSEMTDKINFRVPVGLTNDFENARKKSIIDHVNSKPEFKDKVHWTADKLRIEADVAKGFFQESCDSVAKHLKSLFSKPEIQEVTTILMVGGFSESPMLQDVIKKTMHGKKIIIPPDAGLAVLKGAVIFGHNPEAIRERRCRYTYGLETSVTFQKGVHPDSRWFVADSGAELCSGVFDKHVEIGQPVVVGESQVEKSYSPTKVDQKQVTLSFFASEETNPMFTSDPKCTKIGTMTVELEGTGLDRSVSVQMMFAETELHVSAVTDDGKKTKASLNFLG